MGPVSRSKIQDPSPSRSACAHVRCCKRREGAAFPRSSRCGILNYARVCLVPITPSKGVLHIRTDPLLRGSVSLAEHADHHAGEFRPRRTGRLFVTLTQTTARQSNSARCVSIKSALLWAWSQLARSSWRSAFRETQSQKAKLNTERVTSWSFEHASWVGPTRWGPRVRREPHGGRPSSSGRRNS